MALMWGTRGASARPALSAAALLATLTALTGCVARGAPSPSATVVPSAPVAPASGSGASRTTTPTPVPPDTSTAAGGAVAAMSLRERAGAVLMTAATVDGFAALKPVVSRYRIAGVMVRGRSSAGVAAVRKAVGPVAAAAPDGLPLLVATDQEGGEVQVLRGPGFAAIPSAVRQAAWSPTELRRRAEGWAAGLAAAGINLDLAPVADTPCAATRSDNPPVADLLRNYGTDPRAAGRALAAVVRGFDAAGVEAAVKHFPGLGCVRANTDTTAHVVDDAIDARSSRLTPFRVGLAAGAGFVMLSSATYRRIDPERPALFSSKIIDGLLRERLGFAGVVMSDDVGGAAATKPWSPGERATRFIGAGGDLLLDIVPGDVPSMVAALEDRAARDPSFRARLTAAATRVVAARLAVGAAQMQDGG